MYSEQSNVEVHQNMQIG